MRKFILTICVTFVFAAYVLFERHKLAQTPVAAPSANNTPAPVIADNSGGSSAPPDNNPVTLPQTLTVIPTPTLTPTPAPTPAPTPKPAPQPNPAPAPKPAGQFKDGQYTGNSADAYYGNVQVQATISGGRLTGVQFLDYPQDRRQSQQISSYALPRLTQEAIAAQSANVDIVSSATQTSLAFQQSLASALAQAKN